MSAARDLVAALVAGGMDPIEASTLLARAAVEMTAVVIRKSPGARRQEAWRDRNKASQSVSARRDDEPSQSVSNRLEASQRDAASLSKKERKEDKKEKRESARASQLPEGWLPDEHVWKAAVDRIGLDRCNAEFTKFKNHAADKGRVSKNWNAAWRNWVDRALDYGARNGTGTNVARADTAAGRATTREANQVAIVGAAALRFLREGNPAGPIREAPGDAGPAESSDFEPKAKAAC